GEGLLRRRGILVVPAEDVGAAREDLAVLGELELDARERLADGVEAEGVGAIERERRRRLREAVALDGQHAVLVEELLHLALEARAARKAEAQAPPRDLGELRAARLRRRRRHRERRHLLPEARHAHEDARAYARELREDRLRRHHVRREAQRVAEAR